MGVVKLRSTPPECVEFRVLELLIFFFESEEVEALLSEMSRSASILFSPELSLFRSIYSFDERHAKITVAVFFLSFN